MEQLLQDGKPVTRIKAGLKVKGEITCKDNLVLDGNLKGNLKSEALVYIGPDGAVHGDIEAKMVIVDGEVIGNIHAKDRVELRPTAKIVGDIRTARAQISEGSTLTGNLTILGTKNSK